MGVSKQDFIYLYDKQQHKEIRGTRKDIYDTIEERYIGSIEHCEKIFLAKRNGKQWMLDVYINKYEIRNFFDELSKGKYLRKMSVISLFGGGIRVNLTFPVVKEVYQMDEDFLNSSNK